MAWLFLRLAVLLLVAGGNGRATVFGNYQGEALRITANFTPEDAVAPDATLELHPTRPLSENDGRLAVLIGDTDVTALCVTNESGIIYKPRALRLPVGQTAVVVYLVSSQNDWTELARLPLFVEEPKSTGPTVIDRSQPSSDQTSTQSPKPEGPPPFQFIPSISVNVKSQSTALFFPESSRPDRVNFTDLAVQASLQGNYARDQVSIQNQFDLAGSSVQNEALRFGELGKKAMQVDLSSYLMQYQFHTVKLRLGHISFGSNRELINSFSSRGISLTVPINKRFDVSGAIMNGTSIVGFNNFLGVNRSTHQILSATLGMEVLPKRPGGFRIEISGLRGSLLPLNNFNQGNINDAQRSHGASIRIFGVDKKQRLHFDGGFSRSRFTNPADPLLYQGRNVIAVRPVSRNARYLEIAYDLLQNYKLTENRPMSLNVSYHHEKVDPLYQSIAAFAQADRLNNQLDLTGNIGEITFGFDHTRANDNLAGIRSILRTLTRRYAFSTAAPAAALFNVTKPSMWWPRLSYTFDRTHQFAGFIPINGDFTSPTQIPNQVSTNQTFSADWQLGSFARVSYHFNHSFQDNRQLGRERTDFLTEVNGVTVGVNPVKSLDLNFDVSAERSSNFDQNTLNNTLRFGPSVTWRMTGSMVWAMSASTTGAGDRANTNHRRDVDFDIQYSWRFLAIEKNRWKKVQGQFFIRYANRYGMSRDLLFGFNSLTKLQTFNAGLNFTFF
jgi:hypothetical protein